MLFDLSIIVCGGSTAALILGLAVSELRDHVANLLIKRRFVRPRARI